LIGRGAVHVREVVSHSIIGFHVEASWSGRICTEPVLSTLTRRIWPEVVMSVVLLAIR
jgi:hypothetical protein